MTASKKKPQLDPSVRQSVALLWAYNGDDLVLLTYLPGEQRFDEYCQSKRKGFPVLSLGSWFMITYQRYVKCEARVHVLDASVIEVAPIRTRLLDAFVQLCVPFGCTAANPYTDEYTYTCPLGNITLKKAMGAGPKKLMIWCSLQKTAWWSNPIFEQIESICEEEREQGKGRGEDDERNGHIVAQNPGKQTVIVRPNSGQNQHLCQPNNIGHPPADLVDSAISLNSENDGDDEDEEEEDELGVDPDFAGSGGTTNATFSPTTSLNNSKTTTNSIIDDPIRPEQVRLGSSMAHQDLIQCFDWTNLTVGIIVERIVPNSADGTVRPKRRPASVYSVFPLCSNDRFPGELKISSTNNLQVGQWICYKRSGITFGDLYDGDFRWQEPMFRTMTYLGKIVVECQIEFPMQQGGEIRTVQIDQERLDQLPSVGPFIRHICDDLGVGDHWMLLGTRRWATLEYTRMDWSTTKSYWKIVHIRPEIFDNF